MTEGYDIVIAGGGLAGAVFAATLGGSPGGAGLRIAVMEKQPFRAARGSERFDSRVVAITEASRLLLVDAGAWTGEVAERASAYVHMEVRDGDGTGLIEFDSSEVHQPDLGHIVENSTILAAVYERLHGLHNVEIVDRGIDRVTAGHEAGERPSIMLDDGSAIVASLLVAADGANSLVREQCGFNLRSWDYGHTAVVTTIRTSRPHGRTAFQWFRASGPLALLPLLGDDGDCHYSSIVWSQDHRIAAQLMALGDEEFRRRLALASEHRLGDVTSVSPRISFPLRQCHATDYVKPGVVLVGDAAHTIHPLAGQGMNMGFADVAVLAQEIVRGIDRGLPVGHLSTLERYQRRRKAENLAMMAAMEGFKRLFANENPLLRIARNRGMSGLNALRPLKNHLIRRAMGF